MRFQAEPRGRWRLVFAWFPLKIGDEVVWLELYWRRFAGDCFEVLLREERTP